MLSPIQLEKIEQKLIEGKVLIKNIFRIMNIVELSKVELESISGGKMSPKSFWIGVGMSVISPVSGVGYAVGYYVNS